MKSYIFLILFCFFTPLPRAFGMIEAANQSRNAYQYPAIEVSADFANRIFMNPRQTVFNCPKLFDNSIQFPNGTSLALCDDAQLGCLRYGLIIQKMARATGPLLAELKKVFEISYREVTLRLHACYLVIEATGLQGKTAQEAAGYPDIPSYGW